MAGLVGTGLAAFQVVQPIMEYRSYRKEGKGMGISALKAGLTYAEWAVAPGTMMAINAAQALPGVMSAVGAYGRANAREIGRAYMANFGGGYHDTQNAYTMRQRGVQAIENSKMNVRSVLGSEARMSYRNNITY